MTIVIERNIPCPPRPLRTGEARNAAMQMQIGDSAFFTDAKAANRLAVAIRELGKNSGTIPAVRQTDGGMRVWKIAKLQLRQEAE